MRPALLLYVFAFLVGQEACVQRQEVCCGWNVVAEQKILNGRDPEAPVQQMWSRNCIFGKMWTQLSTRICSFLHVIAANIRKYPGLILLQDREVVTNP